MTGRAARAGQLGRRKAGRGTWPGQRARTESTRAAEDRHPIITGYDGSTAGRHALAYAAGMARRLDGWLVVVHVWQGDSTAVVPLAERMSWLRCDLADADLAGLDIEMIVRYGNPARN